MARVTPSLHFLLSQSGVANSFQPLKLGDGATSIVEMLFCTSLVALVGAGDRPSSSTRRLQIVNTKVRFTLPSLFPFSSDLTKETAKHNRDNQRFVNSRSRLASWRSN